MLRWFVLTRVVFARGVVCCVALVCFDVFWRVLMRCGVRCAGVGWFDVVCCVVV